MRTIKKLKYKKKTIKGVGVSLQRPLIFQVDLLRVENGTKTIKQASWFAEYTYNIDWIFNHLQASAEPFESKDNKRVFKTWFSHLEDIRKRI